MRASTVALRPSGRSSLRQCLAGAALLALGAFGTAAADSTRELVFLTWSEYLDPALVTEFEAREKARIRFVYYETDHDRDNMMVESGGQGYDLAIVNQARLELYARRGWLAPIDRATLSQADHLDPKWLRDAPDSGEYGVPYFWGTLGIGYRRDLVPEPLTRWKQLLEPAEALHDRIVMIKEARDLFGVALKSLGYSLNAADRGQIKQAAALLERQKPHVHAYSYLSLSEKSTLVTGEVVAAMMYSGDALMVQEHHPEITYVVPEEGCNLWVDYLAVLQSSPRKALAHRFVDFLNEPANAARNARFVYYATPNRSAEALLPAEHLEDPIIYPPADVLARCEVYRRLPPRSAKLMNGAFSQIVN